MDRGSSSHAGEEGHLSGSGRSTPTLRRPTHPTPPHFPPLPRRRLELYALEMLPILLRESKLLYPDCESDPSTATVCPDYSNPYSIEAAYQHAPFWLGIPMACLLSFGPRLAIKGWHGVVGTPTKNAMLVRSRRRDDRNGGTLEIRVGLDGAPPGPATELELEAEESSSRRRLSTNRNTGTGYAFSENEPAPAACGTRRAGGATPHRPVRRTPARPRPSCALGSRLRYALGG